MGATLPGWLIVFALGGLAVLTALRSRRWLAGRSATVDVWQGLISLPRRYLVDVHAVVSRRPRTAWMHALIAAGFLSIVVLAPWIHVAKLSGPLPWLAAAALALMSAGIVLLIVRRWRPAASLTKAGFSRLPFAFAAFLIFELASLLPRMGLIGEIRWSSGGGLLLLALGVYGCVELLGGMAFGPMKHALNGALHLIFHPRPQRFSRETADAALGSADIQVLGKLGVETSADLPWNRLLGFDACVECGRCEEACPAFAAGLPLNPKRLIQDLVVAQKSDGPIVSRNAGVRPETLWACTTCRACVQECPMMIEHVDAIVDLRRFQTLELGETPGKAPVVLDNLRLTDNAAGHDASVRLDWAADLELPLLSRLKQCDVLLWLGSGAFESDGQRTLRSLVHLMRKAEVDFAVLGAEEMDCGDLARRLGDEVTFQSLARRNIELLSRYRFKRILTADPHVLHTLRNEYPALGGRYELVHHTAFLASLLTDGRLQITKSMGGRKLTYHDPCYLARYNGEVDAPRVILGLLGADFRDMARSGRKTVCCGGGGGAPITDIAGKRRLPDVRMEQVRETHAEVLAVACPNCSVMLNGVGQPRPVVRDVAELLNDAVGAAP